MNKCYFGKFHQTVLFSHRFIVGVAMTQENTAFEVEEPLDFDAEAKFLKNTVTVTVNINFVSPCESAEASLLTYFNAMSGASYPDGSVVSISGAPPSSCGEWSCGNTQLNTAIFFYYITT
jgi:hypothetical protein